MSFLYPDMDTQLGQDLWVAPALKVVEEGNTIAIKCDQWPIHITLCMTAISGGAPQHQFILSADELARCLTGKSDILNFTDCRFTAPGESWSFECHDTLRFALAMMLPIPKLGEIIDSLAGDSVQIVRHPTGLSAKMKFNEFSSGAVRFSDAPIERRGTKVIGTTTGRTLEIQTDAGTWHLSTDSVMLVNDHVDGYMIEGIVVDLYVLQWKCSSRGLSSDLSTCDLPTRGRSNRSMTKMDISAAYIVMLLIKLNAGQMIICESD